MPNATRCKSIVGAEFFKPVFGYLDLSRHRRNCPALTDALWLEAGIRRCLGLFQSGRDFLQDFSERHDTEILLTTFFESLKSKRRLALLSDILSQVQAHMRQAMPDAFAAFKCLDDFDLYAGDGHFIAAASHDKAAPRKSPAKGKSPGRTAAFATTKYATGHLYSLNLRNHCVTHLTVSDQVARKKEHDMRALKRQDIQALRQGAGKGRKVLYIWDRAGIDFRQWHEWKQNGIYFLSREKENMNLETLANHPFDRADPINQGVMEEQIFRETGIRNEAETKRKTKTLVKRDEQSKSIGGGGLTVLQQCIQRLTQRTVKFIRWLKNHLDSKHSWTHALARLAKIYARS